MKTAYIAERAKFLKLAAISVSEGMKSGGFRSCFRGQGVEFDSVREYERGDDVRSIDWNVTARSGKPFIKLYREERELTVFLVVDNSLSMGSASGSVSKREKALETAALLAFAAEQNASPVGSVLFDGNTGRVLRPRAGRDQVLMVLTSLERQKKPIPGSALGSALAGTARILRSRSLVIIISDFRMEGYEKSLAILARRHDVLAVRITSPSDIELPSAGLLPFQDPETGERASFPTSSAAFRDAWEKEHRESVNHWERLCLKRGVSPLQLSTDEDAVGALAAFFNGVRR